MAVGVGYPSGTNTYVPNHAASNSLVVGFSRTPGTFQVSRYTQYIRAKNNTGLYFVWTSRMGARILTSNDAEHNWSDGEAAPKGFNNLESGTWKNFICQRKAYPFAFGRMAVEQATYPLIAAESAVVAQQAMTARTMLTQNALSGAAWGANTIDVSSIPNLPANSNWTTGSVGFDSNPGPVIKISFQYAEIAIHLGTIGQVTPNMMAVVVNPVCAQGMAASTEIQDYLKQSQFARDQLYGNVPSQNGRWGLPDILYNHSIVVEDAVRVSSRPNAATDALSYVQLNNTAYMISRQGDLDGIEGMRSYSTVQIFFYVDELTVKTKYDSDDERYLGRVVSNYQPVTVTTLAGFKFTKTLGGTN